MREQTCCFTGHRDIPNSERSRLYEALFSAISALIKKGVTRFRCGGAPGFDTAAALTVLDIKKLNPQILLIMDIPCKNQSGHLARGDRAVYDYILSVADEVHVLAPHYYSGCMQFRNRYMVDRSSYLIAYQTEPTGGSAYTVAYAESQGLSVIRV